ncbi:MAG: hypothetical protein MJ014_00245 [Methanocorpusculum sp.]|nr:hypothetical protein [Methanocorpusculum sp.]
MSAEHGSSCEGCELLQTEQFKNQTWYRCGASGRWNGYTVGIDRMNPILPAWCPIKKEKGTKE